MFEDSFKSLQPVGTNNNNVGGNTSNSNSNSTTASTENNSILPNHSDGSLQVQNSNLPSSSAKRVKRQITEHLDTLTDYDDDDVTRRTRSGLHVLDRSVVADCGSDADSKKQDFLERNRIAASKCRQKKKEHIQNLQLRHDELSMNLSKLKSLKQELQEELFSVQNTFLASSACDCEPVKTYLSRLSQTIK